MSMVSMIAQAGSSCTVMMRVHSQSSVGGDKVVTSVYKAGVPCRVRLLAESERDSRLGREGNVATHRFYFASIIALTSNHSLVFGGQTYDVAVVNNPHHLQRHMEVDAVLRT